MALKMAGQSAIPASTAAGRNALERRTPVGDLFRQAICIGAPVLGCALPGGWWLCAVGRPTPKPP
jgi:hypothetical protein